MGTASFFFSVNFGYAQATEKKRYSGQQVGNVNRQTNRLAPKTYKKLPSKEKGNKSLTDFVLMISPFGDAK